MNECESFFKDFNPEREKISAVVRETESEEEDMVVQNE
jgi:hypothetical protein